MTSKRISGVGVLVMPGHITVEIISCIADWKNSVMRLYDSPCLLPC